MNGAQPEAETPATTAVKPTPSVEPEAETLPLPRAVYFGPPRGVYLDACQEMPRVTPEEEMAAALCAQVPPTPYPKVKGARMSFPIFVQWWYQFEAECAQYGIDASVSRAMAEWGFVPELTMNPNMLRPPREVPLSQESRLALDILIKGLLSDSHIEEIDPPSFGEKWDPVMQFHRGVSFPIPRTTVPFAQQMFVVPKPGKVGRAVLNCKPYNHYIVHRSFRMEGVHTLRQILQKDDYMTSVDLTSGYHTVSVHEDFRKHFVFRHRGKWYRYRGLPFGASSACRAFTKCLRPIAAYARSVLGIRLIVYLDDWCILHQDPAMCVEHTRQLMELLTSAGFLINVEKSSLRPSRSLEWLGWTVDSRLMRLRLPYKRRRKISRVVREVLTKHFRSEEITLRDLLRVKGGCQAADAAVYVARLRTRSIQRLIRRSMVWDQKKGKVNYDLPVTLDQESILEMSWWLTELPRWNGKFLHRPSSTLVSDTDAAGTIGGAMVFDTADADADIESRWHWIGKEFFQSINMKELRSFPMGAYALEQILPSKFKCLFWSNHTDNTSAMCYVNRQGGRYEHMSRVAEEFWEWLLLQGSHCLAIFKPGVLNVRADYGSRYVGDWREWKLTLPVWEMIQEAFGSHDTDLFASRQNAQLPRYYSYWADPDAAGRDALSQNWELDGNCFAHPPFALITHVLRRIRELGISITLVAPLWPAQPWMALLMSMSEQPPLLLPQTDLLQPTVPLRQGVAAKQPGWRTAAFRLCGKRSLLKVFSQEQWQRFFASGA